MTPPRHRGTEAQILASGLWYLVSGFCVSMVFVARLAMAAPWPQAEQVLRLLVESRAAYAEVEDYTAHFTKEEWIKGRLGPKEEIFFKFHKPQTVFMAWIHGWRKGQQVLFAKGHLEDKMFVRPSGLAAILGILRLDPHDPRLREFNPKPIDQAGIGYFLERFSKGFETAHQNNELAGVTIQQVEFLGELCQEVIVKYQGPQYEYPKVLIRFSQTSRLPIHIELYDAQHRVVGRYTYANLRLNVGPRDPQFLKLAAPSLRSRYLAINK